MRTRQKKSQKKNHTPKRAGSTTEWLYGRHAVRAALEAGRRRVYEVVVSTSDRAWTVEALEAVSQQRFTYNTADSHDALSRLVGNSEHQGVVAKVARLPYVDLADALAGVDGEPFLVVLDRIQDPHNLGAIIRTALGCGADAVIIARHEAVTVTPAVAKASAGASEWLPVVQVNNVASCLNELKNKQIWTVGLAGESSQSLYDYDFAGGHALVMGAEGKGLHKLVRESCDILLKLPIAGAVGSYNVSVAAAMAMGELQRQRNRNK